jgi:hypothetical protein
MSPEPILMLCIFQIHCNVYILQTLGLSSGLFHWFRGRKCLFALHCSHVQSRDTHAAYVTLAFITIVMKI